MDHRSENAKPTDKILYLCGIYAKPFHDRKGDCYIKVFL